MNDLLADDWFVKDHRAGAGKPKKHGPLGSGLRNDGHGKATYIRGRKIGTSDRTVKIALFRFKGRVISGAGACLLVNGHPVPINSMASMPLAPPVSMLITFEVMAMSEVVIEELSYELEGDLRDLVPAFCGDGADTLVVTPSYPSSENMYLCGFVHSRVREYLRESIRTHVASISENWYQLVYAINGVNVFKGGFLDLKNLILRGNYKTIVMHFADERCLQILDCCRTRERLVFICHGPETLFEYLPNKVRPYFTKEIEPHANAVLFELKKKCISKYARDRYSTWIFVSKWLQEESERRLGIRFSNSCVIHNTINEKLFPYVEKDPELRKSILIIRKFDNVSQHAIDLCVFTIHELARRPFFGDLNISIYGDGSFFDELLNPVKQYPNVRLFRTFLPNDGIAAVHAGHGILLLPSRHDAHAVSMSEGASSGLVVVGSDVTSNGDFMNNAANRTMAEPENYMQLADIIERLYRNPAEFSEISRRMSEEIRTRCSTGETAAKEAWIIKKCIDEKHEYIVPAAKDVCKTPVLTLAVPAYNVEKFLDKCLFSLVNRPNVGKTEILVINDGSTDSSLEIAMEYAGRFKGMVRVIDKKNGGHGSAINAAIREARGVYLRLIDGDDWVDSAALAEQVERLESETADIVLTEGMYEYADRADLQPILNYDCLREGTLYDFDDLCWQFYGFFNYGPMLPTATYRTGRLREAQIQISEKMAYVDMEFNALTLLAYRTLRYYNLNVYRYLIGRSGQSVARETWKKKYRDHEKMLLKLVDLAVGEKRLSPRKREYLIKNLIAPVTDTHVFMLDQLCRWDELDEFMKTLKKTPYIHSECIKFINAKNGESKTILARYKFRTNLKMLPFKNEPIIGKTGEAAWRITPAKMIKAMVPYGIIRAYQKGREGSGVSGLAGDFWDRVKAVID